MKDTVRILLIAMLIVFTNCSSQKKSDNLIKQKIENQIGFKIPDFGIINQEDGTHSFYGDYSNTMTIQFKDDADMDSFYKEIENKMKNQSESYRIEDDCVIINDYWSIKEGVYRYSFMTECPKRDDKHFELVVTAKDRTAIFDFWNILMWNKEEIYLELDNLFIV